MEIRNILIKFKQFIKTADYNQNIERVYFCGSDDYEEKMLFEVVSDSVDIRAMRLVANRIRFITVVTLRNSFSISMFMLLEIYVKGRDNNVQMK
ncbi:MAG: hypothetical protein V8R63_03080 [Thomasclavelia ramosa]